MRVLIVRLSSLGDVVHAIPVAAALRNAFPEARIDWVVDERYQEFVELITVIERRFALRASGRAWWVAASRLIGALRRERYDVAVDAQGLVKSAVVARLSGARRVIGFPSCHLRERWARWLYTEVPKVGAPTHVVAKNLVLATCLGARPGRWEFPIDTQPSTVPARVRQILRVDKERSFALINPGAAWPSKCWVPERYGALASWLRAEHGVPSAVCWGPGEEIVAHKVVAASDGAAVLAPPTSIIDLVALTRAATIMIGGDTGPIHIAAAVGTPVIGLYGPSDPARNGPWSPADVVVSRYNQCRCQQVRTAVASAGVVVRQCCQPSRCLADISVEEVAGAVEQRLATLSTHA